MEALFRIPRPNFPGYLQSKIEEELHVTDPTGANSMASMQSVGKMFGLTFWENWYVLGDTKYVRPTPGLGLIASAYAAEGLKQPDLKLIFYTGHTLQGSYKGTSVLYCTVLYCACLLCTTFCTSKTMALAIARICDVSTNN